LRASELTHWGHRRLRLVEQALWRTSELSHLRLHLRLAAHHSTHLPTELPHPLLGLRRRLAVESHDVDLSGGWFGCSCRRRTGRVYRGVPPGHTRAQRVPVCLGVL
jgi:hypothetical protein